MRRLTSFQINGATLGATVDGRGTTGILFVTGGTQTRIGAHRMAERLAWALAARGLACFRFDRRGVGDSEGEDPGFLGSGPDIAAAAAAFRASVPGLERMVGFGLCDGATALALFGAEARLDGLILANPWLIEAAPDVPAPAAIRNHYRQRLSSLSGWKDLLGGAISYRKLFRGVAKMLRPSGPAPLAVQVAQALATHRLPVELVLAARDATAVAATHEMKAPPFRTVPLHVQTVDSDSHSFARPGDQDALLAALLRALERIAA